MRRPNATMKWRWYYSGTLLLAGALRHPMPSALAFAPQSQRLSHGRIAIARWNQPVRTASSLAYQNGNGNNDGSPSSSSDADNQDWQLLNDRLFQLRLDVLEQEVQMPPNPRLDACDFVQTLLRCVRDNDDPRPDAGFRVLLRTATDEWKRALYESVGAPHTAPEDVVASALGEAMGRPDNQYALLVGASVAEDHESDETNSSDYVPTFPHEPVDYDDGDCWVECRLRAADDHSLLVSTGWTLRRNDVDGAWMVAKIDWQDFRDQFRPGIGREEWMRVCY